MSGYMDDIKVGDKIVFWSFKWVKRKTRLKSKRKHQRIKYMDPGVIFTVQ